MGLDDTTMLYKIDSVVFLWGDELVDAAWCQHILIGGWGELEGLVDAACPIW
jgi:hypothetical protein